MPIVGQSCLASDNKKWKISREKCVDCSPCPLGKARNFTEPYVGPSVLEGDTRCLPCRECPTGSFVGENGCQPCRILCDVDYKRDYDEICESSHDARCGSCLFGYEDTYRNSKYPCSVKHVDIGNGKEYPDSNEKGLEGTVYNCSKYNADMDLKVLNPDKPVVKEETSFPVVQVAVTLSVFIVVAIIIFFLLTCFLHRRRNHRTVNIESTDEDIELQTDGDGSQYTSAGTETESETRLRDVGNTQDSSQMIAGLGRTVPLSIESSQLTIGVNTQFRRAFGKPYESVPLTEQLPCGCHNNPDCQCYISDLPNTEIQKNDKFILTVSTSMCHSPDELFDALMLDHTVRYPVQNDREIDPVRTTFQDKNLRLLNRWVEIQSTTINLDTLMKALCESRFHKINQKLKDKYSTNIPLLENDNGTIR